MKALKSKLAKEILKTAFYDKDLSQKLATKQPFEFNGKTYVAKNIPTKK